MGNDAPNDRPDDRLADRAHPSPERDLIASARREAEDLPGRSDGTSASEGIFAPIPPSGTFPGYDVVRAIQRGGQGVVYLAVQQSTRRQVAIKVPHEGAFARFDDLARFEREIEILARLEHPGIVTILDRGTAAGRHWFAMDYIAGPTLDRWIDDSKRTREEVLAVFVKICRAVHAAHMQGVIHRDLKPTNIRVDAANEPHILDFGLAKPVNDADDALEVTHAGDFIGTPVWASPEQLAREPSRVGTLTDVYSLGLILYKLLTGRPAFANPRHRVELLEALRRAGPEPASSVSKDVDDELSTIVGKCLRHDQSERYQSVHELARDIEHYLAGEPIEAKRDSRFYLLRKALGKHRAVAAVAAAAFVVVLATAAYALVQRNDALAQRNEAIAQREAVRRAAAANAAFIDLFEEQARSIDPAVSSPSDVRMQTVLDDVASTLDDEKGEPTAMALIHRTLGRMYLGLTDRVNAEKHLRAALAIHESRITRDARSASTIAAGEGDEGAVAAIADGEPEELQVRLELGLAIMRSDKPDAAREAESLQRAVLARREELFGARSAPAAESHDALAAALYWQQDLDGAEQEDRTALSIRLEVLGANDPLVARSWHQLGLRLLNRGRRDRDEAAKEESLSCFQKALAILEQRGRAHDLGALSARTKLASALMWLNRKPEARVELERAVRQAEGWLPETDSRRTEPLLLLAQLLYLQLGDAAAAVEPARECLDGRLQAASDRRFSVARRPAPADVATLVHGTGRALDVAEPAYIFGLAIAETGDSPQGEAWLRIARSLQELQGSRPSAKALALAEHDAAIGHVIGLSNDPARRGEAKALLDSAIETFTRAVAADDRRLARAKTWRLALEGPGAAPQR